MPQVVQYAYVEAIQRKTRCKQIIHLTPLARLEHLYLFVVSTRVLLVKRSNYGHVEDGLCVVEVQVDVAEGEGVLGLEYVALDVQVLQEILVVLMVDQVLLHGENDSPVYDACFHYWVEETEKNILLEDIHLNQLAQAVFESDGTGMVRANYSAVFSLCTSYNFCILLISEKLDSMVHGIDLAIPLVIILLPLLISLSARLIFLSIAIPLLIYHFILNGLFLRLLVVLGTGFVVRVEKEMI